MHYRRWRLYGDPHHQGRAFYGSDVERFWHFTDIRGPAECWPFRRRNDRQGYGYTTWGDNRYIGAHRVSYLIHYGEIPAGHDVCHRCDRPWCVNPAHLFTGTESDNMHDMAIKGRARNQWGRP